MFTKLRRWMICKACGVAVPLKAFSLEEQVQIASKIDRQSLRKILCNTVRRRTVVLCDMWPAV
jgi:hypothetical protein